MHTKFSVTNFRIPPVLSNSLILHNLCKKVGSCDKNSSSSVHKFRFKLVGQSSGDNKWKFNDFDARRSCMDGQIFTKAMAEILLGHWRENLPLVIIRPTIVTSTYKDPFPGWIEGVRTVDSFMVGYCTGKLTCIAGDPESIIDVIPADMVVNSMIVTMSAYANQPSVIIHQVSSSVANPLSFGCIQDYAIRYFTKNPWIGKDGSPVIVGKLTVLSTMASFHRYMAIYYLLPLKGLELVNATFCKYFHALYLDLNRKINFAMRLMEIYRPYLFFKGSYDDLNTEKLRMAASESGIETALFYFDPKCINWDDYFMNEHSHSWHSKIRNQVMITTTSGILVRGTFQSIGK